ncbi:hypothetical protein GDO86_000057 [Hymenochirus boettgeri]|uniref:B-cell receptor CD22 n=1 Tax=Hymenochirus boettgeri TaxID=247094 RepID=A0A8T2KFX2_9PIPI|nr:hypothetical protein GDO86_000057 [Hymenochirus boettgeri]
MYLFLPIFHIPVGVSTDWDVQVPDTLQGIVGSCLLIPCTFTFPSDVQITDGIVPIWYKDKDLRLVYHPSQNVEASFQGRIELLGDLNLRNCTTLLKDLQREDKGDYLFRFEISLNNKWTSKKSITVTVTDVPALPDVVMPQLISEGESVTFQCSTPYNCPTDAVSLEWQDYIPERSSLARNIQQDTSAVQISQSLTTSFTWRNHHQTIRCEVNVGTHKMSKEILLNIQHSPKGVTAVVKPSGDNIKQGHSVTLTCQYNSSYPAVSSYTWYKDNREFSKEQIVFFPSITRSDFGDFRCEVENPVGSSVSEVTRVVVFSAKTLVSPSSEVREGEMVTLTCEVPGSNPEEIHYSWFKNSIWIKEGSTRSLILYEASVSDAGYYNCKVQNDKGSDSSLPVIINVLYPPRIPMFNSFLETQEGKQAIVHCTVDSNPLSELSLYKNGNLLATTTSHSAPTQRLNIISSRNSMKVEIRNVLMSDEGTYSCLAKNSLGNSTSSLQLTVEIARVVISPSSEIEEGIEVTLTCFATRSAEKDVKYTWYKNGKWLKESEEISLVFRRISSRDAGSYYCLAQSSLGSSSSPPRTLHVMYAPRDLSMNSLVEASGGNMGFILCMVDSDPHSELYLYKNNALLASSSKIIHNRRYNVLTSANSLRLEIQNVLVEDEGTYLCSANNTYGHTDGLLAFTTETARIFIMPSPEVHEEETVNLTCVLNSDAKETFMFAWYKNGALYWQGPEPFLVFDQAKSGDSGSYYCRAWNNETSKDSASVSLHVLYAPRDPQLKSFVDTSEGRTAFILCTVDSYPPAEMLLFRQNELVISSSNHSSVSWRYSVSISRNTLKVEIKNLRLEDEGKYNCTFTNSLGSVSETIYFKVQLARILITPSTEVLENEKVTLTCDMTKTQLEGTMYIWYKNSQRLRETSENTLVFDMIKSDASGYYHCKAHSSQDNTVSPSVSLHVSYTPRVPIFTSFWESLNGQVGIIECNVDSDPPSSLALYKGEHLVGLTGSSQTLNARMKISSLQNSLKLVIHDVMLEDEGTYLCIARNSIGESRSTLNFTAQTSRILITPSSVVQEGVTVNLTCKVSTDSPQEATYTWFQNGNFHPRGNTKTLLFGKVSVQDGGSYYCLVQSVNISKASPSVNLNVTYSPRNAYINSFLETQNGKVAIVQCGVDSNPPSKMLLMKDDHLVASSTNTDIYSTRFNLHFSLNTLRLEIKDLRTSDEGNYIFTATNIHGTSTVSAQISVGGARVVISPIAQLQEGQSVTLTCDVLSTLDTGIIYTWYKNSRWFQESPAHSLVFGSVSSSDAGSYSCTANAKNQTWTSSSAALYVHCKCHFF